MLPSLLPNRLTSNTHLTSLLDSFLSTNTNKTSLQFLTQSDDCAIDHSLSLFVHYVIVVQHRLRFHRQSTLRAYHDYHPYNAVQESSSRGKLPSLSIELYHAHNLQC